MFNISKYAQIFDSLSATSSRLAKEKTLKEAAATEGFLDFCAWLFNDNKPSGIAAKKFQKAEDNWTKSIIKRKPPQTFDELTSYLTNHNTGTDEDCLLMAKMIYDNSVNSQYADFLKDVVLKNNKWGITKTTINKMFPDLIPTIGIMRGKNWEGNFNSKKYYLVSQKLDGCRLLTFVNENGAISAYSRSGKPDAAFLTSEIAKQMIEHYPRGYVFDGELLANGTFINSIEQRQATASLANTKSKRDNLTYWIFDVMPINQYNTGKSTWCAAERKTYLQSLPTIENIVRPLPTLCMTNDPNKIMEMAQEVWNGGGEGLMLVDADSPYVVSNSPQKTLLKVKERHTYELIVTDVIEGQGEFIGTMGALQCIYLASDGNAYDVKVGSGFTFEDREIWWNDHNLIQSIIEVESFGESHNKVDSSISLNCPIFKRIKGQEDYNG